MPRTRVHAVLTTQVPARLVGGTLAAGVTLLVAVLASTVPYAWNVLHP